jgi:hypothetical protein
MGNVVEIRSRRPATSYWVEFEVKDSRMNVALHDTEDSPAARLAVAANFMMAAAQLREEVSRELASEKPAEDAARKGWITRLRGLLLGNA